MKYCPACGAKNADAAKFCAKCGASFADAEPVASTVKATTTPESPASTATEKHKSSGNGWIGAIIGVIIVGIVLIVGGHSFYLNHRSAQATADIGQTIANKEFGDDEVRVYYSKSENTFTIKTLSGSAIRSSFTEYVEDGDNQSEIDDVTTEYQRFIDGVEGKMGSKYREAYYTYIENPWDSTKVFWDSRGTKIGYNWAEDN